MIFRSAAALTLLLLTAPPTHAANYSFTGTFAQDDEVQLFNFVVGQEATVQFRTYSYAGGTQANGNVVVAGGFDPILAVFDSAGRLIGENDDDMTGIVANDPINGAHWDTFLSLTLAPGAYAVSVMQFANFSLGSLADGFTYDGAGNFTPLLTLFCEAEAFCDSWGLSRTNQWAFDILGADEAVEVLPPVPLPAAAPLLLGGLAGLTAIRRR